MDREPYICEDCGATESEEQWNLDQDCRCGGSFKPKPYEFPNNPVAKPNTAVLTNTPGTVACQICGCRNEQRRGCYCKCHYAQFL